MRNMNFPLDIIFIADEKIVKIYHNLEPEGSDPQKVYSSEGPVDYVVELRGARARDLNLEEGDEITFPELSAY